MTRQWRVSQLNTTQYDDMADSTKDRMRISGHSRQGGMSPLEMHRIPQCYGIIDDGIV